MSEASAKKATVTSARAAAYAEPSPGLTRAMYLHPYCIRAEVVTLLETD